MMVAASKASTFVEGGAGMTSTVPIGTIGGTTGGMPGGGGGVMGIILENLSHQTCVL